MQRLLSILTLFGLPLLSTSQTALYNNGATLTATPGATVQVSGNLTNNTGTLSNGGTLRLAGAINNSGILTSTTGTIEMIGSTPQTIAANTFSGNTLLNLKISNTSVISAGALNITGALSFGNVNNSNFNTSGLLTLKSTATNTALIADVTNKGTNSGNTITGNVTVERYLSSASNRAYRLLAPSVNTTTFIRQNWQENGTNSNGYGTHITGSTSGANGFDATITGQGSLFTQDNIAAAWVAATNTDATTLNAKTGYLLYVRGNRTIDLNSTASPLPSTDATLRATGSLLMGAQAFTGLEGNSKFSLIANPYAAPINWASVQAASTGVTQFYHYWDPNIGTRGGYVTVKTDGTKSVASNAGVNIQSGQAFFVQASGAPIPTVNIAETHKSTTNNLDIFRLGTQTERFGSSLYFKDENNQRRLADGVLNVYNNSYSKRIDGDDAPQMANWDEDIAIKSFDNSLSIEARPLIDDADTIALTVARLKAKTYEWQFDVANFDHPNLQANLVDNFLSTRTPISLTDSTVIPFTVTTDAASSAFDRFQVVFGLAKVLPLNLSKVKAYSKGQSVEVEWTVQTEINMDKYEVEKSATGQAFTKVATVLSQGNSMAKTYSSLDATPFTGNNYYRIKSISKTDEAQYSIIVKVNTGKSNSQITLYPNPVTGNTLTLQFDAVKKGDYSITLIDHLGQQLLTKSIQHSGGTASQTINLPNIAKGAYEVKITGNGKIITQKLIKN